jgi:hypothetical protein
MKAKELYNGLESDFQRMGDGVNFKSAGKWYRLSGTTIAIHGDILSILKSEREVICKSEINDPYGCSGGKIIEIDINDK